MSLSAETQAGAEAETRPWLTGRLAPAPSVRRLTLGGHKLLFCERRQQLFELDPSAAVMWDAFTAGRQLRSVAEQMAGEGLRFASALALCAASAQDWIEGGWLIPQVLTDRLAGPPTHVLPLRVGGSASVLELRMDAADPIARQLDDAFGQFLAEPATDAMRIDVVGIQDAWWVLENGAPSGILPRERVVPEVKARLTEELCRRDAGGGFLLHAALLASSGQGLLLSGAPGAGKTTLALALAAGGLGYGSDDVVTVSPDAVFRGVPFSPAVKTGAWRILAGHYPALETLPIHQRPDDQAVRYLPARQLPAGDIVAPRWALLLERREEAPAVLEPLDPLTVLSELLGGAFAPDHRLAGDAMVALARSFADIGCYRLVYSDLTSAVTCVMDLVRR